MSKRRIVICLFCLVLLASCRKTSAPGSAAREDILKNLESFVEGVKSGLSEAVTPRFRTFGPVPTERPWDRPVATGSLMVMDRTIPLRTGRDGLIHERYEARPCPLRPIFECVELLATGRFGPHGEVMCFGFQLQKSGDQVVRQEIPMRPKEQCPYQAAPGPAARAWGGAALRT